MRRIDLFITSLSREKRLHYLNTIEKMRSEQGNNYHSHHTKRITVGDANNMENPITLVKNNDIYRIKILDIIECGFFWASIDDEEHNEMIRKIQLEINDQNNMLIPLKISDVEIGQLVGAIYIDEFDYSISLYRAKIQKNNNNGSFEVYTSSNIPILPFNSLFFFKVIFIDFGNEHKVDINAIFKLSEPLKKYPPQAFKCKLINIKPDKKKSHNNAWPKSANEQFERLVQNSKNLEIEV
jgi:hypothetical protein